MMSTKKLLQIGNVGLPSVNPSPDLIFPEVPKFRRTAKPLSWLTFYHVSRLLNLASKPDLNR
jgi:hypothetical protein